MKPSIAVLIQVLTLSPLPWMLYVSELLCIVFVILCILIPAADPHFKNVSNYQVFTEGTDAVVQCPAFLGDPEGEMYWLHNNEVITDDNRFIPAAEHLTIQNALVDDSDSYQCVLYRNGVVGITNITVVVQEHSALAPRIVDPVNPIVVMYGQPLNLTCQPVEEKEKVLYTWTVDTPHEHDHFVNTTSRLYREPDDFLGGRYTCRVENQYGYDEQLFFVKILGESVLHLNHKLAYILDHQLVYQ